MGRKGKKNRRSNNRNDRRSLEGFSKTDFQQESETMKEELNSVKDTIEEIKVAVETTAATSANTEVLKDDLLSLDRPVKEECNTILEKVLVDENVLDVPKCSHSSLQIGVMTNTFQEDAYKESSCKQVDKESEDYLRKWSAMKDIFEPLTKSNILSQYNEKINRSVEKCPEIPVAIAKDWSMSSNVYETIYKSSESISQVYPTLLKDVSNDSPLQTKTSTEFYPNLIEDNINKDSTVSPTTVIDHKSVLSEKNADDCSVLPEKVDVCQASSKAVKQDYVSLLEVDSEVCTELSKTTVEAVDKNPFTSAETVRLSPPTSLKVIQQNCSVSTETSIKDYPLPPGTNADEFFISTETVTEMSPTPFETINSDNPVPEKPLSLDITEECTELLETVIEDCCASFKTDTEQYNASPETVFEISVNKVQTTVPESISKQNPVLPEAIQENCIVSSETFIEDCSALLEAVTNDCPVTYETIEDISLSHDDDTQFIPALDQVASLEDIKEDCSVSRKTDVEENPTSSVTDFETQGHNQMSFLTQPDVISHDTAASSKDATKSHPSKLQSLADDAYPMEDELFIGDPELTASIYDASSAEPSATIDDTLSVELALSLRDDPPWADMISNIDDAPSSEHAYIDNVTSTELTASNNDLPCAELTATKDYASCSELTESEDNTAEMKKFNDIPFEKSIFSKACSLSEKLQTVNLDVMEPPKVCLTASDCSNSLEFCSTIAPKDLHISITISSEAFKLTVGSTSQQLPHKDFLSLKSKNSESKKSPKCDLLKNSNSAQSVFENIFIMSLLALIWLPLRIFLCFYGKNVHKF